MDEIQTYKYVLEKTQGIAKIGSWEHPAEENKMYWSREMYKILGFNPDKTAAGLQQLLAAVHADDRQRVYETYSRSCSKGCEHDMEYRLRMADGDIRHIHDRCEHLRDADGKILRSVGFLQDVTEIKEIRKKLKDTEEELDQFASLTSHDLQEPLRAISGFLQLLDLRYRKNLDENGINFIERSIKAASRMELLITKLLQFARITSRGSTFSETDLNTILDEVTGRLKAIIRRKNAKINSSNLPVMPVDGKQIATLFHSLIINGLQYNENEKPVVTIDCEQNGINYHFSFNDNGIGIASKFHKRILDPFQRLHNQHEYPGTGMGLTICKKIIERHGGSIWLESAEVKGSTFHFTLPAKAKKSM